MAISLDISESPSSTVRLRVLHLLDLLILCRATTPIPEHRTSAASRGRRRRVFRVGPCLRRYVASVHHRVFSCVA